MLAPGAYVNGRTWDAQWRTCWCVDGDKLSRRCRRLALALTESSVISSRVRFGEALFHIFIVRLLQAFIFIAINGAGVSRPGSRGAISPVVAYRFFDQQFCW